MSKQYSEDTLIEQPAIVMFEAWDASIGSERGIYSALPCANTKKAE